MTEDGRIGLRQAAAELGVHYMTAYRYVRTGRLAAERRGTEWQVDPADLAELAERSRPAPGRHRTGQRPEAVERAALLEGRMTAGDEAGAWKLVQEALTAGVSPSEVLLRMLSPALGSIGRRWEEGSLSVGTEHRASGVATRLVGRLGPLSRRRGTPVATVVVGAPPGEHHQLPVSMAADLLRAARYEVVDLGADVPVAMFAEAVTPRTVAACIGVTGSGHEPAVAAVTAALAADLPHLVVMAGGAAIGSSAVAERLGARWSGTTGDSLVEAVDRLRGGQTGPTSTSGTSSSGRGPSRAV